MVGNYADCLQDDFDRKVLLLQKELKRKARPSERVKSEEELAKMELERLKKQEVFFSFSFFCYILCVQCLFHYFFCFPSKYRDPFRAGRSIATNGWTNGNRRRPSTRACPWGFWRRWCGDTMNSLSLSLSFLPSAC